MNHWWNNYDYKDGFKNNAKQDLYFKNIEELVSYRHRVEDYFNQELSDEHLCSLLISDNGDLNHWLLGKVGMIITSCFFHKESVNNCAIIVKEFLDNNR